MTAYISQKEADELCSGMLCDYYGEIGEQDRKSVERALKVSFGLLHSKKKRRRK